MGFLSLNIHYDTYLRFYTENLYVRQMHRVKNNERLSYSQLQHHVRSNSNIRDSISSTQIHKLVYLVLTIHVPTQHFF